MVLEPEVATDRSRPMSCRLISGAHESVAASQSVAALQLRPQTGLLQLMRGRRCHEQALCAVAWSSHLPDRCRVASALSAAGAFRPPPAVSCSFPASNAID